MERHQVSGRRSLGFLLASTTMLLWGVLPIALKVILAQMDATTITFYRFLASALTLGVLLGVRGRLPSLRLLAPGGRWMLAAAGLFLGVNYLLYLMSLDLTTPADAQVILQIGPLLLAVGGMVFFRERFGRVQWTGFAVLVLGLGVFFRSQLAQVAADVAGRDQYLLGNLLMVGAATLWAMYGLVQKQLLGQMPSEHIMLCIYAGCAVLFVPLASPSTIGALDGVGLAALAFCALNTVVGYGAFAEALEHWEASRVSAMLALTPIATLVMVEISGVLWPALEVGQGALPWASLAGAVMVVAGSLVTSLAASDRSSAR